MAWASRRVVWAGCAMAIAVAGCGGSGPSQSHDAMPASDATSPDQPGADAGSDSADGRSDGRDLPCYKPTDCSAGLICCLMSDSSNNFVVSCQPSPFCVGDGQTTFIACATSADCPATRPMCTFLAPTTGGDFNICD